MVQTRGYFSTTGWDTTWEYKTVSADLSVRANERNR
jgi:hypothetical protein